MNRPINYINVTLTNIFKNFKKHEITLPSNHYLLLFNYIFLIKTLRVTWKDGTGFPLKDSGYE